MRRRVRRQARQVAAQEREIDRALEAMSAPELRAAVRAILDQLDEAVNRSVMVTLITLGTKAASGWKPTRPSPRIVEDARSVCA